MPEGVNILPSSQPPPLFEWVLAYWPHMKPTRWTRSKRERLCAGWYPTRRTKRGWQFQASRSFRLYPVGGPPPFWTRILTHEDATPLPAPRDELECLEHLMRVRFGGTRLRCPSCDEIARFHLLRDRRVYACPHCLFQIAPTANTILHDTRTPLMSWFRAAKLLKDNPQLTAKELQRRLGVTYKCAWRIRDALRDSSATSERAQ